MKKRLLYLIILVLAITMLSSCGSPSVPTTVQTPDPTDNVPPISASPRPSASQELTDPVVSPIPTTPATTLLTYDEAEAICSAWLDNHAELTSYSIPDWEYEEHESELSPPPTYFIFGEAYYEFYVSGHWDYSVDWDIRSGYSHVILVHEETGKLLSVFKIKPAGETLTSTVEQLDDWYSGEHSAYAPAILTVDDVIEIYNAWLDERIDELANPSAYRLDEQSYEIFVIFGEPYYYFHAEDDHKCWYNILVHMETGEMLYMMTSDGTYPEKSIEPLNAWYDDIYVKSPIVAQTWQDAYAEFLRGSDSKRFFLCDIDEDGTPELLVGGPSTDTDKYADYDVHTFKNYTIECIGAVGTLSWSSLWIDNKGGILGYSYGAGAGGTYRYYIDNGVLRYDGDVYGYYFDGDGNQIEWFRGADGSEVIVTEETRDEYQHILNNLIELECYEITESNIIKVIYIGV